MAGATKLAPAKFLPAGLLRNAVDEVGTVRGADTVTLSGVTTLTTSDIHIVIV